MSKFEIKKELILSFLSKERFMRLVNYQICPNRGFVLCQNECGMSVCNPLADRTKCAAHHKIAMTMCHVLIHIKAMFLRLRLGIMDNCYHDLKIAFNRMVSIKYFLEDMLG